MFGSSAVMEWNLVCEDKQWRAFAQSFFMLGVLLGSYFFGDLSDRFGRKPTFFVSVVLQVQFDANELFLLVGQNRNYLLLDFLKFSACGGNLTVLLLSRALLGHLRDTKTLEDCLTWLTGSSTQAGTDFTDLQLISSSVADCQALI